MGMEILRRMKKVTSLLVSASANADGSAVDVQGYDEAHIMIGTKALAAGITALNCKVEQADDSGFSTNAELITGAVVDLEGVVDANGEAVLKLNLNRSGQRRYIRVITEDYAGTGTYVVCGMVGLANRHRDVPDSEHGTVVEVRS